MCPLGLNRSDINNGGTSYRNGTPIDTATHNFGNPVTLPYDFGNDIPSDGKNENRVTWLPDPAHFGNVISDYAPMPTFGGVSPSAGSTAGGTPVTVSGTGFISGAEVTFGGAPATSVVVVNSTTITCDTPAGTAGLVDVEVITLGGIAVGYNAWTYTAAAAPTISSVSGSDGTRGSVLGSTHSQIIQGTGFVNGCKVSFGGTLSSSVIFINSTQVWAQPPAHAAGVVDVTLTNPDTQSATAPGAFTYIGLGGCRQMDSTGFPSTGALSFTYFEYDEIPYFLQVGAGDTLIAVVTVNDPGNASVTAMNVTSVTDNYSNTWVQVAGARKAVNGQFIDIWVAYNVSAVGSPTGDIAVTVNTDTTVTGSNIANVMLYDVAAGVLSNGATPTVATASGTTSSSLHAPSIDCGSGAFVVSAFIDPNNNFNAPTVTVSPSPWVPYTSPTGIPTICELGNALTSGTQNPVFTLLFGGASYVLASAAFPTA